MPPAYDQHSYKPGGRREGRIVAALLALAINAILVVMLVRMGVLGPLINKPDKPLITFNVMPEPSQAPARKVTREKPANAGQSPPKPAPKPAPAVAPPSPPTPFPPEMIILNRKEFASANIANIAKAGKPGQGQSSGADNDSAYGPGEGPNGERLYNAEWYREPRDAELALYRPPTGTPEGGWAEIACRTAPDYRVEDCRELGESPPGSRLARMLRQAAWQFRVRPPRIGGKAQIGAWVRIHFDFTERAERR